MIRLGLRLTLSSGREAAVRLIVTAAAVALGVSLLLITLAGINATNTQNARSAWLNTGEGGTSASVKASPDPMWGLLAIDHFASDRARAVLRLTGTRLAPSHHPRRRTRRPLPRTPDRHDRPGGAPGPQLPDHHHRSHRRPAFAHDRRRAGRQHRDHYAQ
jgi:hypothetical protein